MKNVLHLSFIFVPLHQYEWVQFFENNHRRNDVGAQMGAGLMLNRHFFFDFRYILGMQILQREDEMTVKHNGINLSVGYAF